MQKLSKDNVLKPNFPLWVYFRDDSNTKVFFQNSSMNSITHNQKKGKTIEKMQKEVKRPNQISIKFNTTQIEGSTL
jgi:hypothetical protein